MQLALNSTVLLSMGSTNCEANQRLQLCAALAPFSSLWRLYKAKFAPSLIFRTMFQYYLRAVGVSVGQLNPRWT